MRSPRPYEESSYRSLRGFLTRVAPDWAETPHAAHFPPIPLGTSRSLCQSSSLSVNTLPSACTIERT
eukprot:2016206-Alexandrium_andersonii.AAC.1